jgi:prephenate dehydratase
MQCDNYITTHHWKWENHGDTAGSAQYVSNSDDITKGAICSTLAADIYGLNILDTNIQDQDAIPLDFFLSEKNDSTRIQKR